MTTIAIILAAAAAGFGLAVWRRIPPPPLLLLIGVALNATGTLDPGPNMQNTLLLALTFLVFVVGAELDVSRVRDQKKAAIGVGLAQFFILGWFGLAAAKLLGFGWLPSMYVGLAMTASSTLMIVTLLQQRQQLFEPFGRLVVGALLVQDILVVLLLPILTHATDGPVVIVGQFIITLAMVAMAAACVRWVSPYLLLKMGLDEESMLLTVLSILFGFMAIAYAFDVPVVIGAFLAGVALSGFPVSGVVRGQITSLADFFLAVFFVTLGASVTFPTVNQLLLDGMLLVSVVLVTPPMVMVIARRAGLTTRSSIEAAHLLAQCGELSLVVMLLGVERGHIGENVLAAMILLVALTMTLTPFTSTDKVTWFLMRTIPGRRRFPEERPRDHVLLLGCGRHTRTILRRLQNQDIPVAVVDDDSGVIETLRSQGVTAIRGDGADYRCLRIAGAREAKVIVSTMRRPQDNDRLLKFVQGPTVLVRVFTPEAGERIRSMGGTPVVESEAAADQFLQFFDEFSGDDDRRTAFAPG